MRMFIANCTTQNHILNYRLAEERNPISQRIEMGRQDYVGGKGYDLSPIQIEGVVHQLSPYGLTAAASLNRLPNRVVPLIWDDKPISVDVIRRVLDHNKGVKITEGQERRKLAAIGGNDVLEQAVAQADAPKVKVFKMEVEEEDNQAHLDDSKHVADGFVVEHRPGDAPVAPKKRTRKAA